MKRILSSLLILGMVSACQQPGNPNSQGLNKQQVGAIAGAIGGGVLGSNVGKGSGRTAAIIAGTLLGSYVGNQVGASLDRADMVYYNQTSQAALENNQLGNTSTWVNPDSGNRGTVTPVKTFQRDTGQYCREYTQTITVGGKTVEGYGTACRQPDGSWQIQS